jgi:hypothetical protein
MNAIHKKLCDSCLHFMQGYKRDLEIHDLDAIEKYTSVPFLHWTRANGTHIEFLISNEHLPKEGQRVPFLFGTNDREGILDSMVMMAEYWLRPFAEQIFTVHYFDGEVLREIDKKKAVEIAKQHRQKMFDSWQGQSRGERN